MKTFLDKNNQEWTINLSLSTAMEIESFDFAEALGKESPHHIHFLDTDDGTLEIYLTNTRVCFTMVWCCCRKAAEAREIKSMLEFADLFDGPSWDRARLAFFEELPDFFPRRATTLRALTKKYSEVMDAQDKAMGKAMEENLTPENLNKMTARVLREAREETNRILSGEK